MTSAGHPGSLWLDTAGGATPPRPPLPGPMDVDVAIVGAGYTGLWTAYYLRRAAPSCRIAVIEAQRVGFGASGRNGGWCSGLFPVGADKLARLHGHDAAVAMQRALHGTVTEVGRVTAAEGIDCDWRLGGTLCLARTPRQLAQAGRDLRTSQRYGLGLRLLGPDQARQRCGATDVLGATYSPHCAAVHPLKLVRGLAAVVERLGVPIYEQTRAVSPAPGRVVTEHGTVTAAHVVRATEGFTAALPGHRRQVLPIYSLMLATQPLPPQFWRQAGLAERETFTDYRRLIVYGQRTADDRLTFGGRGAPYHFGSSIKPEFDLVPAVHAALHRALVELFPQLDGVNVTHRWGGALGITRDWHPSVGLDTATGLAWAHGYAGDGVAAANLAGRTLSALIRGESGDLTGLPWVNHRSRRWEPEPLRWLGVNAGLQAVTALDTLDP